MICPSCGGSAGPRLPGHYWVRGVLTIQVAELCADGFVRTIGSEVKRGVADFEWLCPVAPPPEAALRSGG